jgi:hypothetical protein
MEPLLQEQEDQQVTQEHQVPQIHLPPPPPPAIQLPDVQLQEAQMKEAQLQEVKLPKKALMDSVDTLYNKMILNSALLTTIHTLKTDGFNNASMPLLILSMMATYNSYTNATPAHTLTMDDVQVLLERVYNYFVDKYDLIDVTHRLAMYNLFDISLKLCLEIPNVKKNVTSWLNFFKCGGRK